MITRAVIPNVTPDVRVVFFFYNADKDHAEARTLPIIAWHIDTDEVGGEPEGEARPITFETLPIMWCYETGRLSEAVIEGRVHDTRRWIWPYGPTFADFIEMLEWVRAELLDDDSNPSKAGTQ